MFGQNPWFETVAEAQRRAKRQLPSSVYGALVAGSERGRTIDDNIGAFAELGFAPHVAGHKADRDLSTTVLGIPTSMPLLISPTGVQAVHPDGEVAVARAAKNRGVIMGLSSFASKPVEEVAAANDNTFFQMYWTGTRDQMVQRMNRARNAGAKALISTLDWSFSNGRDWGSPSIPEKLDLKTMIKFAPNVLPHPAWLYRFAKSLSLPGPHRAEPQGAGQGRARPSSARTTSGCRRPRRRGRTSSGCARSGAGSSCSRASRRVDDAKRAVDLGVDAISVSNHGGNNLDTTPATIRALPAVADAVGDQIEVLLDGGVRRGGDIAKALALGAKAVMIGRAYLWGLAANGQAGVENVLDIMRGGLDSAVLGTAHASVHELSADDLVIPSGFARTVGGSSRADAESPKQPAKGTTPRVKDPIG